MSRIRANKITNQLADGSPTVEKGLIISGVTTSTTFSGSGASLTNLNASNIASGTVPTARLGSGTASSSTFLRGDSTFQTINTDLVSDTSPQLGGNLDVNTKNITFGDSGSASDDRLTFGAGTDMSLYHDGNNSVIENATGDLYIQNEAGNTSNQIFIRGKESTNSIVVNGNGSVLLYDQNSGSAVERLTTTSTGIDISGNLTLPTTDAKIQLKDGNNYIQFVNADKDFKFMNAWGAGEFTFHVNGGERLRIASSGQIGLGGANYGAARQVMVSNGSGSAVSWSSNPFLLDMDSLGDIDYDGVFLRYRETADVTGNGLVYLGLCKSTTNCPAGRIGIPVGFIPGVTYNSHFRVDKVGITPWPDGSGHRYEFYAIISDWVSAGKLGIFYLTNSTN